MNHTLSINQCVSVSVDTGGEVSRKAILLSISVSIVKRIEGCWQKVVNIALVQDCETSVVYEPLPDRGLVR